MIILQPLLHPHKLKSGMQYINLQYQSANPLQVGRISMRASTNISLNTPTIFLGSSTEAVNISYENGTVRISASQAIILDAPQIIYTGNWVENLPDPVMDLRRNFEQVWASNPLFSPSKNL